MTLPWLWRKLVKIEADKIGICVQAQSQAIEFGAELDFWQVFRQTRAFGPSVTRLRAFEDLCEEWIELSEMILWVEAVVDIEQEKAVAATKARLELEEKMERQFAEKRARGEGLTAEEEWVESGFLGPRQYTTCVRDKRPFEVDGSLDVRRFVRDLWYNSSLFISEHNF
jgi:hypothetical protein